jgi:nucleoside-diphosphate-sugar epimerase
VNVLIVGASGFIGGRIAQAFVAAGHDVTCAQRSERLPPGCTRRLAFDYVSLPARAMLARSLAGIDVVVNAVGILRERGPQTFDAVHTAGPSALFDACMDAAVPRVIQMSALGADENAASGYHRSKYAADRYLRSLPLDSAIVQPSLVYGAGGTSARLFEMLAALPLLVVPGDGAQRVQPLHVDDLVDGVRHLAESPAALRCTVAAVGPYPLALLAFLAELRTGLGLPPAKAVRVPRTLVAFAARAGNAIPGVLLDTETLAMLERGNTAEPGPWERWLGRKALPPARFVAPARRESRRAAASLRWLLPFLRITVAAMWIIAAAVSFGLYPVERSIALLQHIGASAVLAPLLLYGAASLDLALGVMTLLPRRPRWIWSAQISLVVLYTLIITWRLPHLWLDPFGPIAKNLPIIALLVMLRRFETRR